MNKYKKYFTKEAIKKYIAQLDDKLMKQREQLKDITAVIYHVGDDEASKIYLKNKVTLASKFNIDIQVLEFPTKTSIKTFTDLVQFNQQYAASIIPQMVQFPVPWKSFDLNTLGLGARDIDGLSSGSIVTPCTPQGIMDYIQYVYEQEGESPEDKNIVILNRSNIVGNPLYQLALKANMNVTQLHSHTSIENKRNYFTNADIIVSATGSPNTITSGLLFNAKSECMVFDVGINRMIINGEQKIVGDVMDFTSDYGIAISPVPGGVGLLTTRYFIKNILSIASYFQNK